MAAKLIRVRMKVSMAGVSFCWSPGQVVEVTPDEAARFLEAGLAEAAPAPAAAPPAPPPPAAPAAPAAHEAATAPAPESSSTAPAATPQAPPPAGAPRRGRGKG